MKLLILSICLFVTTIGDAMFAEEIKSIDHSKVIILLGPPGSGKGTQAIRLSKELSIPHISTGDLFRENISQNTSLGEKAKTFTNSGKLVPDELVLDMLFDRVSRPDCKKGYLLDGFPRTLPQAEALGKHLPPRAELIVLNLEVPDESIVKRIAGRLSCPKCGTVYNKHFSPPREENTCDQCQTNLVQRPDDKAEVVEERLRIYHSQTKPLIEYYSKKGVLSSVDGTKTPDEVFNSLIEKLKKHR